MALWLTESDVELLLDLPSAIAALERGLRLEASGAAENMVKTHVTYGASHTLHAIGATVPGEHVAGTKTWAHTGGGASPLLILFDSDCGTLLAIIEAFRLGQMRTSGISAVATQRLAADDATVMAIIGTGKQALPQVEATAVVRPLKRVHVFSPTANHRAALRDKIAATLPIDVIDSASLEEALVGATIVTLATRARQPFLHAAMLGPGTHINAIGAITPERQEFTSDILERCTTVSADSVAATQKLSAEFRAHFTTPDSWKRVVPLHQLVAENWTRPAGADLTLFKAMGTGLADVSLGLEVLRRAKAAGRGKPLPPE